MSDFSEQLSERLLEFAVHIIRLAVRLAETPVGRHVGNQMTHAGTSAGANYEEACAGESRADFAHKLQVVLKELKETVFWLRVTLKSDLLPNDSNLLSDLITEGKALSNIIAKSIVTVKSR